MFFGGIPGFDSFPGGMPGGGRRGGGPVNNKRYYELLGVEQGASDEIKKARNQEGPPEEGCKSPSCSQQLT